MSRTPKLSDVAQHAGVSVPTVSRVLREVRNVDPELKDRVLLSVKALGYQPNRLAKSLREQRTGIIGYLSAGDIATFHHILAQGIQNAALDHGYAVVTGHGSTLEREMMYAKIFSGYQVDGLVVIPSSTGDPYLEELAQQIPVVEVDRTFGAYSRHSVLLDNRSAVAGAVDHLVALGHRQIGLIYGNIPVSTEVERKEGFVDRMQHHGFPLRPEHLISDGFSEEGGVRAAHQLLQLGEPVTAVVVTTNEMLAGVVRAIRSLGLSIPRDLSLIGMDDTRWVQMMEPPLTVMAQPAYEMGYEAGRLLIRSIQDQDHEEAFPRVRRLPAQLIIRQSTAPPREVPSMST
ncbi:LacI family DNA-binding transcriptional regulator [Deinococcus aquatilis]|uniref:LacI family DNA-binding transcriptional regulator n=1 Tax=Deinococcus aquatilis TaxID=519440 RepID=UPI00058E31BD|nr:LacI family DNA-binding transcriptional regulator [Deinococcus aquatilis]